MHISRQLVSIFVAYGLFACYRPADDEFNFKSIVVLPGEDVELPCYTEVDRDVFWGFYNTAFARVDIVSMSGNIYDAYKPRFTLVRSAFENHLMIKRAQSVDSGLYVCIEDNGAGIRRRVHLSVKIDAEEIRSTVLTSSMSNGSEDCAVSVTGVPDGWLSHSGTTYFGLGLATGATILVLIGFLIKTCLVCMAKRRNVPATDEEKCMLLPDEAQLSDTFVNNLVYIETDCGSLMITESAVANLPPNEELKVLPSEILEIVLLKAVFHSNDQFLPVLSLAAGNIGCRLRRQHRSVIGLRSLFSVCREWWLTVTARPPHNRQLLKRAFRRKTSMMPIEFVKVLVLFRNKLRNQPMQSHLACATAVMQLASICHHWSRVVLGCKYDRPILRRTLNSGHQLIVSLRTERRPTLCAVAQVGRYIYAVEERCREVKSYANSEPYSFVGVIPVDGLTGPRDMVGCDRLQKLFVADAVERCIWSIGVADGDTRVEMIATKNNFIPQSLSLMSVRLLVVPDSGVELFLYNADTGRLLRKIATTGLKNIYHAVESPSGHLIISHGGANQRHRVSRFMVHIVEGTPAADEPPVIQYLARLVDSDIADNSNVTDDCRPTLRYPHHLALDAKRRVLIADYGNNRVVVLKGDLSLNVELLEFAQDKMSVHPFRLSYSPSSRKLVVGLIGGGGDAENIAVYDWN